MAWRHGWDRPGPYAYGPPACRPEDELAMLQDQATHIEAMLEDFRGRIADIEKNEKGKE
jgi:hypothetical protein